VGPQQVALRLPPGARPKRVQLLVAGISLPVQETSGTLSVTVPRVVDHEVVAVDI
jgi:hypothetical protein